jgi:transposase
VAVSRPTVIGWRARYERSGIGGLTDEPRPGRPRKVDHERIIAETLRPPPKKLGVRHWSSLLPGGRLKVSNATVA